jgi:hypothetical protein
MAPVIYNLATDWAQFGITEYQKNEVLNNYFPNRRGGGVQGRPRQIILHIQDGWTRGSLMHWASVQASSTVMVQRDGSILKVIPEEHGPWTNGDTCNPTAAVSDVLSWGGNPNIWTLSLESEGKPWDPQTPEQLDSIEWQCRDWMHRYPEIEIAQVDRHADLNQCTRPSCPGMYFDAIKKRLSGGTTTAYSLPLTYDWLTEEELDKGIDRPIGNTVAKACRRLWEVKKQTPRRRSATLSTSLSNKVGPDLVPGDTFMGEFIFETTKGWWVLTQYGTRVYMADLTETASIV